MFMCAAKFDVEEKQLAFIKEFLTKEEVEAASEEKDAQAQDTLDPISDSEEDDVALIHVQEQPTSPVVSQRALGKRRKSVASEPEDEGQESIPSDDEAEIPLPDTQLRASTRSRKRLRREDDIWEYH